MSKKNCYGCKHSGMGPDDQYLVCYNPNAGAGSMGTYVKGPESLRGQLSKCGVELKLFEQHPSRTPDGNLLSMVEQKKEPLNVPTDPVAEAAVKRLLAMPNGHELARIYLEGWYDGTKWAGY